MALKQIYYFRFSIQDGAVANLLLQVLHSRWRALFLWRASRVAVGSGWGEHADPPARPGKSSPDPPGGPPPAGSLKKNLCILIFPPVGFLKNSMHGHIISTCGEPNNIACILFPPAGSLKTACAYYSFCTQGAWKTALANYYFRKPGA